MPANGLITGIYYLQNPTIGTYNLTVNDSNGGSISCNVININNVNSFNNTNFIKSSGTT